MTSGRLNTLIGVGGHAIFVGDNRRDVYLKECWVGTYEGYRYDDEIPLYVEHIRAAVILTSEDPLAAIEWSGGYTRDRRLFPTGSEFISEAESYRRVADLCGWFNCPAVSDRCFLETRARDSYENVRLSHEVFEKRTGNPPKSVVMIGPAFKKARYEFHADVIRRLPGVAPFRFRYAAVNDVPEYVLDAGALLGEALTLEPFRKDPHGDTVGGELLAKRLSRDHLRR